MLWRTPVRRQDETGKQMGKSRTAECDREWKGDYYDQVHSALYGGGDRDPCSNIGAGENICKADGTVHGVGGKISGAACYTYGSIWQPVSE